MCVSVVLVYVSRKRPPPTSTLFPYTTLFRSVERRCIAAALADHRQYLREVVAEQIALEQPFARAHPVDVAAQRIDLAVVRDRSEEHTSELQSLRHLVCRLLLEKKKRHYSYLL